MKEMVNAFSDICATIKVMDIRENLQTTYEAHALLEMVARCASRKLLLNKPE